MSDNNNINMTTLSSSSSPATRYHATHDNGTVLQNEEEEEQRHASNNDEFNDNSTNDDPRQYHHHTHKGKILKLLWLNTLIVSVLLGLVSGTLYGFGTYEKDLKELLQIKQIQIQRLGILLDCGNYIGHPAVGMFYDKFGSTMSCLTAAFVVFSSYMSIHYGISISHSSDDNDNDNNNNNGSYNFFSSQFIIGLSFFLVGVGGGLGYVAALGSTTKNFSKHRPQHLSKAIGFVAAGFGLSSTIVGITYRIVGISHFFLLWAFLVAIVNVIGAYFLNNGTNKDRTECNDEDDDGGHHHHHGGGSGDNERRKTKWDSYRTLDFWLLFVSFMCCTGCGLFVINNISTMVQSIHGSDKFASSLVILLSVCNCGGRILIGFLSSSSSSKSSNTTTDRNNNSYNYYYHWFIPTNKITLFRLVCGLMLITMFGSALLYNPKNVHALIITVVCTAIAYGGTWVLVVCILSEWFGNEHFGKNYGLMAMGPALSGMVFNTVSAMIYQHHIGDNDKKNDNDNDNENNVCYGSKCYRGSFVFTGITCIVGFVILSYLASSTRRRYIHTQSPSSEDLLRSDNINTSDRSFDNGSSTHSDAGSIEAI